MKLFNSIDLHKKSQLYLFTIVLVSVLILVNVFVSKYRVRWDLTENEKFSLSPQTREVLSLINEPIDIIAFIKEGSATGKQVENLLKEYEYSSNFINVDIVDPQKKPSLARKYEIEQFNTIIIKKGKKSRTLKHENLFLFGKVPGDMSFRGEHAISRAILDLITQREAVIYFLMGHGEGSIMWEYSEVRDYLMGEGYSPKKLQLSVEGKVPDDAGLIIEVGPEKDITPKEREIIEKYLETGGRLLFLNNPGRELKEWNKIFEKYGIRVDNNLVVDPERGFFMDVLSPVALAKYHATTKRILDKNLAVVFPFTSSVSRTDETPGDIRIYSLFITSSSSWAETDLKAQKVSKDEEDIPGPLYLGFALEKVTQKDKTEPFAVVLGCSAFIGEEALKLEGNLEYFITTVNWLVSSENTLFIEPKRQTVSTVMLTPRDIKVLFLTTVVIIPLAVILLGVMIWWRRRNL